MDYNLITLVVVFFIMLIIGSMLNILFKTTSKINWIITLLLSIGLSIIFTALFNFN